MNLKGRLIFHNIITIITPLLITMISSFIFFTIYSKVSNNNIKYDNYKKLLTTKGELIETASSTLKQKPEIIETSEYQHYLMGKLSSIGGEIIITKGENVLFSSKTINKIDLEKCLQSVNSDSINKIVRINNTDYFIETVTTKLGDNIDGNIILLAPNDSSADMAEKFIFLVIIIFIASSIGINIIMTIVISKRILNPVSHLKEAASQISSGNLDCSINSEGDKEIKEFCDNFELMRIQLKNFIHEKLLYDENRKMLLSSISHDIKTPITSIKGYVEGILDGVANTPDKLKDYLKTIYSKTEQIDVMIDDLLLYSKLDLKQIPFNFEKVDIVKFCKFCIDESSIELRKSNISISLINSLRSNTYVMLDRDRMVRVLTNIIDNSRKYMGKDNGEIILSLRETHLSVIIEIRDTGSGIKNNDINKIFERFYRADRARTGTNGSGLGLAIAKEIVEGHKGKIWAVSHENMGTSIIISLAKVKGE